MALTYHGQTPKVTFLSGRTDFFKVLGKKLLKNGLNLRLADLSKATHVKEIQT